VETADGEQITACSISDFVFFTNGSMTQNSTRGSMSEAPVMNRDKARRGCFTLWEKLAAKSEDFGQPEKLVYDPEQSNFSTVSVTVTDYPRLVKYIEEKSEVPAGTNGFITFPDSPWFVQVNVPLQPAVPNQPDNVQYMIVWGLDPDKKGTYIKKRLPECNGEEVLREFLYWCGLEDEMDEIVSHCIAIPTMMPYITSQFMPRGLKDRPTIIPKGSQNLAFIGQFVELPGDVVFTVETSVKQQ
jgi:oleate hydratase